MTRERDIVFDTPDSVENLFRKAGETKSFRKWKKHLEDGPHPSQEILFDYAVENLPEAKRGELFEHIAHCLRCTEEVYSIRTKSRDFARFIEAGQTERLNWREVVSGLVSTGKIFIKSLRGQKPRVTRAETIPSLGIMKAKRQLGTTRQPVEALRFHPGEVVSLDVEVPEDGYLTAFMYSESQPMTLVFPSASNDDTFISARDGKKLVLKAPDLSAQLAVKAIWTAKKIIDPSAFDFEGPMADRDLQAFVHELSRLEKEEWECATLDIRLEQKSPRRTEPTSIGRILAIRAADPESQDGRYWVPLLLRELKQGRARLGRLELETPLSTSPTKRSRPDKFDPAELERSDHSKSLLRIDPGDFLIYVDMPKIGKCTIVHITGKYRFSEVWGPERRGGSRYFLPCAYLGTFNTYSSFVPHELSEKLRLRGSHGDLTIMKRHFSTLLSNLT